MSLPIAINLMDKIDKIIAIIRYLKEEGVAAATTPTNNVGSSGTSALGFDPKTESPPVFKKRKYAYLGPNSRRPWMIKRNPPMT
jgi:hypothetical protein